MTDVFFWLAFVLRNSDFKEQLFESLKIEKIEIKGWQYTSRTSSSSTRYRLAEEVRLKWVQLEFMLTHLRTSLEHIIETSILKIKFFSAPSEYSYEDFHPDHRRAYTQARDARWAFILQMFYLFFLGHLFSQYVDPIMSSV